jgi:hypothetical protein
MSSISEITKLVAYRLERRESINLVVPPTRDWHAIYRELADNLPFALPLVDLGESRTRPALLNEMLRAIGVSANVPDEKPADLVEFGKEVRRIKYARLALANFDVIDDPRHRDEYEMDFLHTLRYYTTTDGRLGLVLFSRRPFGQLLPHDELSAVNIMTVELPALELPPTP